MTLPSMPIDFKEIRKGLVRVVEKVTDIDCIVEEPVVQGSPRPPLPYFSFKIINPADRFGDDHMLTPQSGTVFGRGGQRRMTVSFHCYAETRDDAYNYMSLLQSSFDLETVQAELRIYGIAVWVIGGVADFSQLLNTGYEARAHMDTTFGIAFNLSEDLGSIEHAQIHGEADTGNGTVDEDFTAP